MPIRNYGAWRCAARPMNYVVNAAHTNSLTSLVKLEPGRLARAVAISMVNENTAG